MGIWVHWVLYNIPDENRTLPKRFPDNEELVDGIRQGKNTILEGELELAGITFGGIKLMLGGTK